MPAKYYYDGNDRAGFIRFTQQTVFDVVTAQLQAAGLAIGDAGLELLRSGRLAEERARSGRGFLLFSKQAKVTPKQVIGHDDSKHHSGRRYDWGFRILASRGTASSKLTGEQAAAMDDELMDILRNTFETQYSYFRSQLHFYDLQVGISDDARFAIRPLEVSFYNIIRLPADEFITI